MGGWGCGLPIDWKADDAHRVWGSRVSINSKGRTENIKNTRKTAEQRPKKKGYGGMLCWMFCSSRRALPLS